MNSDISTLSVLVSAFLFPPQQHPLSLNSTPEFLPARGTKGDASTVIAHESSSSCLTQGRFLLQEQKIPFHTLVPIHRARQDPVVVLVPIRSSCRLDFDVLEDNGVPVAAPNPLLALLFGRGLWGWGEREGQHEMEMPGRKWSQMPSLGCQGLAGMHWEAAEF